MNLNGKTKSPPSANGGRKGTLMYKYIYLPDQSQMYEEKPFRYTRRPVQEDPPIEIIAECHLCGVKIADGQEVILYNNETFCSRYHVNEYKQMEADGEL